MSEYRIVTAKYDPSGSCVTEPAWKGNYGNILRLEGFPEGMIPETFEMHFSVGGRKAKPYIGTNNEVQILDECLTKAVPITAWLFLHDTENDGETKYEIRIPVRYKDDLVNEEPTPVQQSVITQAIAALNTGVERAEAAQEAAEDAQEDAEAAADRAEQAATAAQGAAQSAAEDAVEAAEAILEGYKQDAESAATRAENSATDANSSREAADVSATNAGVSERNAAASATAAAQSVTAAAGHAQTASQKAAQASNYADYASASASNAETSAGTAGSKASEAAASAHTASQKAQEAASSATSASQSATDANTAKTAAQAAKSDAQTAKADAQTAKANAETAAGNAAQSATSASNSATAAGNSATAAQQSADAASATLATAVQTINTAGATQVQAVNTAGATQVAAVQAKGAEVLESIPEDYSSLVEDVDELNSAFNNKAPVIISSASGDIASFDDGADGMPIKGMTVSIEPVQSGSGDPSPDNVRPITGWTGCNISHSGADTSDPTVYPITFPSEAGTVYGGSLTVNEDGTGKLVLNGVKDILTVANGMLQSEYFTEATGQTVAVLGDNVRISLNRKSQSSNMNTVSNTYQHIMANLCPHYFAYAVDSAHWYINNQLYLFLPVSDVGETVESFKNYLATNPFEVYVQLATPIEYTLTAQQIQTILGVNCIWADTGAVEVTYRADTKTYIDNAATEVPVQDVQVNGTSILNNGVANVPIAGSSAPGVAKVTTSYGMQVLGGAFAIQQAADFEVKAGTHQFKPIVPYRQHVSSFYGLAKAAGDSTQSASSNAVGTYTETARSKIHDMLDAPVFVSGTTPSITALPGVRYVCGEVSTIDITTPESGVVDIVFTSGSTPAVLTVTPPTGMTMKWANGFDPSSLDANTTYEINIADGLGVAASWT